MSKDIIIKGICSKLRSVPAIPIQPQSPKPTPAWALLKDAWQGF